MMTHDRIWSALDRLAQNNGLSPSGLARAAGLDPTAFNKSKRISVTGKRRWPSTESIAKVLKATHTTPAAFLSLLDEQLRALPPLPLLTLDAAAESPDAFDVQGQPAGGGWTSFVFPPIEDPGAYALEIRGDAMLPLYRHGDIVIVSPAKPVRRGDRAVVCTSAGDILVAQVARRSGTHVDLLPPTPASAGQSLDSAGLRWIARIIWASQ